MAKKTIEDIKVTSVVFPKYNLIDIVNEYQQLAQELELGEFTPEMEEKLIINQEHFEHKLLGYKYVIDNLSNKVESLYKAEIERFGQRVKNIDRRLKFIKEQITYAVNLYGTDGKFKGDMINVSAVKTQSLQVDEIEIDETISSIKSHIYNGEVDSLEVDSKYFKVNINTLNLTPKEAEGLFKYLSDNNLIAKINIELNKDIIKEELLAFNNTYETSSEPELELEDSSEVVKEEFPLKGVSIKNSYYPRFS